MLKAWKNNQCAQIILLSLGRIGQIVAQIVSLRVATTLLLPAQMGTVNQMVSAISLGYGTLVAPVSTYVGRGLLEWSEAGAMQRILWQFLRFVLVVALVLVAGFWLVQSGWNPVRGLSPLWVALLLGLGLGGQAIDTVSTSGLNLLGHRLLFIFFSNLSVWLGLGLAAGLLLAFKQPEYWVLGQGLGVLASSSSILVLFHYASKLPVVPVAASPNSLTFTPRKIYSFSWPLVVTQLFWWFQAQGYRFVLDWVAGLQYVGLFSVGYGLCAMPLATFENVFNQYYGPYYYAALKGADEAGLAQAWNNYARAYVPALILAGAFVVGSGPFMCKVFLGEKFQGVSAFLVWPALTETIRAIGSTIHSMGLATLNMRIIMAPVAAGAAIATLAVYFLARVHPLHGTGLALLLAAVVSVGIGVVVSMRTLPIRWPLPSIGAALLLALPLVLGFRLAHWLLPQFTVLTAILALLLGGSYLVVAEYLLAREWMKKLPRI